MNEKDIEFKKRLQAIFKVEAEEHVRAISAGILELEKKPEPEALEPVIENIFREAHTLKGAARVVNLLEIESICQPLESVFSALKPREIELSPGLCALFHKAADTIARLVASAGTEPPAADSGGSKELINLLASASHTTLISNAPVKPVIDQEALPAKPKDAPLLSTVNSVRIPVSRLEPLLVQAEEMLQIKMAHGQRITELIEIKENLIALKEDTANSSGNRETLLNKLENHVSALLAAFKRDRRIADRMVDEQLETMKHLLMLPVGTLFEAFPGFVRSLALDQGKEVELIIRGEEIELDKRILDELKDPFMHIIRNCIDHGIKKPDERAGMNKTAKGTITITVTPREGRQVEILIADDGAGIEAEQVRLSAVKSGVITEELARGLNSKDALALIFQSGVSTSPIITEISGRGLGLAIVRDKIDRLGGTISLKTSPGAGTAFLFLLPLSLSTFRGVMAKVGEQLFIFPAVSVSRVIRVKKEEIKSVENRETILADGQVMAAVSLGKVLQVPPRKNAGIPGKAGASGYMPVIILSSGDKDMAFMVDEILDEQQFLVKSLGRQLHSVRNIAGAAVLGNGRIVPVINIQDLIRSAVRAVVTGGLAPSAEESAPKNEKILVAEDSITSRTLLKNILEAAGYQVATAVDGADAFAQVRAGEFDLVVSDVDMPRMNGFELTAGIRADKKLAGLPVVLVTALGSREDRERGIDAGANAYIVKGSFDQSNLLEAVKQLI